MKSVHRDQIKALPAAAALAFSLACGSAGGDGVAATVNGYKITTQELDRYYQGQIQEQGEPTSDDQAAMMRLNLLRELVDRQVLLQKAEELGLLAVEDEVNERFDTYRAPFANDEEFLASLRDRGLTREDLRTEIRRSLTVEKLFNKQITSRVKVSDAEMRAYYDQNTANFALSEQHLHLAQIVVTDAPESPVPNLLNHDAEDKASAQAKIQMLEQRLNSGEDFAELAQSYSEDPETTANGGDLGYVPRSSLENADLTVRRVVAALSPGDVSPVVETDGQYRLIKLIDREDAGQRDFSDPRVQQSIRELLINRKDQLRKAAFLDAVRGQAVIENYFARRILEQAGVTD
jgi:peptidyl-prolyl cis-trans isomerase SurA